MVQALKARMQSKVRTFQELERKMFCFSKRACAFLPPLPDWKLLRQITEASSSLVSSHTQAADVPVLSAHKFLLLLLVLGEYTNLSHTNVSEMNKGHKTEYIHNTLGLSIQNDS